jgi:hypothetical protein
LAKDLARAKDRASDKLRIVMLLESLVHARHVGVSLANGAGNRRPLSAAWCTSMEVITNKATQCSFPNPTVSEASDRRRVVNGMPACDTNADSGVLCSLAGYSSPRPRPRQGHGGRECEACFRNIHNERSERDTFLSKSETNHDMTRRRGTTRPHWKSDCGFKARKLHCSC